MAISELEYYIDIVNRDNYHYQYPLKHTIKKNKKYVDRISDSVILYIKYIVANEINFKISNKD